MALYLDHKYIAQLSSRLEKFKRKSQRIYNFRCPICGDSSKSKIKARGYFYTQGDGMKFHCHNCLADWTFSHFLQEFADDLYQDYVFEKYKNTGLFPVQKDSFNFDFKPHFMEKMNDDILDGYFNIDKLPLDHYARQYIERRQIPKCFWKDIWFIPDFKKLVDKFEPENEYQLREEDARIVFPFRDREKRITAIQGRSFESRGLRYITIKIDHNAPKVFGLDRVNPENRIFVCEGPVDSFFLPNSIACAGSNLGSDVLPDCSDVVYIFDNEPRNKAIVDAIKKLADSGKEVCVWPDDVDEKDINDMILAGKTSADIIDIINANTYTGLAARIAINEWKRC